MMITAMKVAVAFQTMCHTTGTSPRLTAPVSSARTAPAAALQPTPNPLGCQITKTSVTTKIDAAMSMSMFQIRMSAAGGLAHGSVFHGSQPSLMVVNPGLVCLRSDVQNIQCPLFKLGMQPVVNPLTLPPICE